MRDLGTREKFIQLRARGNSYDKISKEINVSKPTLLKWRADLSEQISEAKILELDALLEQFELSKACRVKALANHLKRVEDELSKRDLSDIKTERLFEIAQNLQAGIVSEVSDVKRQFNREGGVQIIDVHAGTVTALD